MNIRKLLTVSALATAAMVFASEARAQIPPQPVILPVIKPICPQPMYIQPLYRPLTISTPTLKPCIPVPQPAPKPVPRPITPCPKPIIR